MATWIECPKCHGVLAAQTTDDVLTGKAVADGQLMHRDGAPISRYEMVRCDDCGAIISAPWVRSNYGKQRRTADALPPKPATAAA